MFRLRGSLLLKPARPSWLMDSRPPKPHVFAQPTVTHPQKTLPPISVRLPGGTAFGIEGFGYPCRLGQRHGGGPQQGRPNSMPPPPGANNRRETACWGHNSPKAWHRFDGGKGSRTSLGTSFSDIAMNFLSAPVLLGNEIHAAPSARKTPRPSWGAIDRSCSSSSPICALTQINEGQSTSICGMRTTNLNLQGFSVCPGSSKQWGDTAITIFNGH